MYQDFYLKFADEAEANSVLYTTTPAVVEVNPETGEEIIVQEAVIKANYANIDTLGVLYNNDAVIGADGEVITPATEIPGWHVNVRTINDEDGAALESFKVEPKAPRRVWA